MRTLIPLNIARTALVIALVGTLGLGAFSTAMLAPLDHNEQMYVTAGTMAREQTLYHDFAFLQMPYLPLLLGMVFGLSGTTHYLLAARLLSFIAILLAGLLVTATVRTVTRSLVLAASGMVLFMGSGVVARIAGESSNYTHPMALSAGALYLFVRATGSPRHSPWLNAASGLLAGLAVGFKLYYAALLPVYLLAAALSDGSGWRMGLRQRVLPLLAGMATALAPVLPALIRDPGAFIFDNLGYHWTSLEWRRSVGHQTGMTLASKLHILGNVLRSRGNLALLAGSVLAALAALRRAAAERLRPPPAALISGLLAVVALLLMFVPTPMLVQYLALPAPFLAAFALVVPGSRPGTRVSHLPILVLAALSLLDARESILTYLDRWQSVREWTAMRVHETALQVRQGMEEAGVSGKVATLSPLFAIEAGLPIYRQLATGPFLYRVGDFVAPALLERWIGTSPARVSDLLDRDPPAAVLAGFEGDLDEALIGFAQRRGYRRAEGSFGGGVLWVRPRVPSLAGTAQVRVRTGAV